jgi:putative transcriptional regulator
MEVKMDFPFDIFKIDKNNIKPKQGRILISDPFLTDNYFRRSVVLLTEHNEKGTVGFVLNNPVSVRVNDILAQFPNINSKISIGGPVSTNTVHYLHTLGEMIPNSVHVLDEIYWGGDFEVLKQLIQDGIADVSKVRFFIGYSGWEPDQLRREISEDSWIVSKMSPAAIMTSVERATWNNALKNLGGKYKLWLNFPENPGMN